jgi:glycosyltransferase involved in cell wall biosynthesis
MDNPLVSIVLTSYNQPDLLETAFQSLISQTYKNIEIIIVDDCSTDPLNRKLILKFQDDYPAIVRYILHDENKSIPANKNSGFKIAKGEFITFLDGDDHYLAEKIENEINLFKRFPDLDVVYSNFYVINTSKNTKTIWADKPMPQGNVFRNMVEESFPGKVIFRFELARAQVYINNNFYDEAIPIYHDWDFRIRYSYQSKIGYVDKVLSIYNRNEKSITVNSSLSKLTSDRFFVIEKNLEIIKSDPKLAGFFNGFKRDALVNTLFDFRTNLKTYIYLLLKTLLIYPFQIKKILQSIRYRIAKRKQIQIK